VNTNGSYASETGYSLSGGGVSSYPQPSYQVGVSTSGVREVPDVSFDADYNTGIDIIFAGSTYQVGGTSIGAPAWAGLFALADQERTANGLPLLSSVSALEAMYATYGSNAYSNAFHDIVGGSNGEYSATVGYDDVTGLGSPIANELVPYLAGDMSLAQLTPEPASATMLLLAAPLLLRRRCRRRCVSTSPA
jgi:subtilase family serine protease